MINYIAVWGIFGSVNEKVEPLPGALTTIILLPCSLTIPLHIARPSPLPPISLFNEVST